MFTHQPKKKLLIKLLELKRKNLIRRKSKKAKKKFITLLKPLLRTLPQQRKMRRKPVPLRKSMMLLRKPRLPLKN